MEKEITAMGQENTGRERNSRFCVFVVLLTQWTMAITMGINATALNPAAEAISDFVNRTYTERYDEIPSADQVKIVVVIAQSSLAWGSFGGSLLVKVVINKFSRKGGVAMSHILNLISVILMSPAAWYGKSYEALIIGRTLNGIARGVGYSVVAVVVAETTVRQKLSSYQGPYTYLLFIGAAVGVALGHSKVCGNADYWPILTASSAPFSIIYLLAYPWLPQTPGYFLVAGQREKAKETFRKLRVGEDSTIKAELAKLQTEIGRDSGVEKLPVWALFKKRHYRRQMIAAVLTLNCTQFVGIQALFFFSNTIFREAGVPEEHITFASIAIFAQCIIPGTIAIFLVRRIGTRKMFLIGTGIVSVALTVFTIASALNTVHRTMPYVALAAMILFLFGNYLGIQITVFALPSELTTQITRPAVMLVGSVIYWITACGVGTVMPYTISAWGAYAYVPFILAAIGEFLYGYFVLPETFKQSSEEIQQKFAKFGDSSKVNEAYASKLNEAYVVDSVSEM